MSITNFLWAGPSRLHHTDLRGDSFRLPGHHYLESWDSNQCYLLNWQSNLHGEKDWGNMPTDGRGHKSHWLLPLKEHSLLQMTRIEAMSSPAGGRKWRPALLNGTDIYCIFTLRQPWDQELKNQVEILGGRCREGRSGGLYFGVHKILVPFSQIWVTNRPNIPLAYYVSSLRCLWT